MKNFWPFKDYANATWKTHEMQKHTEVPFATRTIISAWIYLDPEKIYM